MDLTNSQSKDALGKRYFQGSLRGEELRFMSEWVRADAKRLKDAFQQYLDGKVTGKSVDRLFYKMAADRTPFLGFFGTSLSLRNSLKKLENDLAFYEPNEYQRTADGLLGDEELRGTIRSLLAAWGQDEWRLVRSDLEQLRESLEHYPSSPPSIDQLQLLVKRLDHPEFPLIQFLAQIPVLCDAYETLSINLPLYEQDSQKRSENHLLVGELELKCIVKKVLDELEKLLVAKSGKNFAS